MSRYLIVLSAAFVAASVLGCENSKLQREMMGDSTWETSAGYEDVTVKEQKPQSDDEWERENAPLEGEGAPESEPQSSVEGMAPRARTGVIVRDDLVPVLEAGLGSYLGNVEMEPTFHQGTFAGFRLVSFFPGDLDYAGIDLRPGDIVTHINGRSIERPEQAVAVWEDLRTADDLVVHYRRGEQALALRFRIVDVG
jgi:hypothetical protein